MQNITERPADSLGAFSPGLAVQERDRQTALQNLRKLRREARDQIDRLIRFLDESDLDPDLEDGGDDEPWLGFLDGFPGKGAGTMSCDDLERDDSDDEDGADDEPSLGAAEYHPSVFDPYAFSWRGDQTRWAISGRDDREGDDADDPRGEEVNEDGDDKPDDEPSLGWTVDGCFAGASDLEADHAEA